MKVLLATDASEHSRAAEAVLAGLRWPAGSAATVLGVVRQKWSLLGLGLEGPAQVKDTVMRLQRVAVGGAEAVAGQAAVDLSRAGLAATAEVREGEPGEAILALAAERRADLIALGAQGFNRFAAPRLGSTAWQVLNKARASVLIARPGTRRRPAHVIVAVDGFLDGRGPEAWPMGLLPAGADITVAKLTDEGEAAEMRALEFGETLQARGLIVRNVFPLGESRAELVRLAHAAEADLIIVDGRADDPADPESPITLATAVAKYAPCSVLVVRPERNVTAARPYLPGHARLPVPALVEAHGTPRGRIMRRAA
jgi:nucleotide-binding universal stress UspA family protein